MTDTIVQGVVLPWLNALVLALAPVLFGYGLLLLKRHGVDTAWFEAIGRAAGSGVTAAAHEGKGLNTSEGRTIAVAAGANYLRDRAADLIAAKGGRTTDALVQIVDAELGKLMAVDPTVPTGPGTKAVNSGAGL